MPRFKSVEEESDFWDEPGDVEECFEGAKEVCVDFTLAREARKQRKRPAGRRDVKLRKVG